MPPIISVGNLSKSYLVGHQSGTSERYTALRDVLGRSAKNFVRKGLDMARGRQIVQGDEVEEFWALKDVSFEVEQGEVLGIIGRNGAGKSTLLKILSRITEPTKGRVSLRGRVASLLEVGTGFHPELTGRENIFLNGAILGMTRVEIKQKFDEIVSFAEVSKFLDTPVKRYSSGMYVRLAFAVAAHLDPEILVVDEVLAVGDAEFQKKCLGKMQDVAKGGRTVLFVSHNMAAISSLTSKSILLSAGRIVAAGMTPEVLVHYRSQLSSQVSSTERLWGKGQNSTVLDVQVVNAIGMISNVIKSGESMSLRIELETYGSQGLSIEVFLLDSSFQRLGMFSLFQFQNQELPRIPGRYSVSIKLAPLWLATGDYWFDVVTSRANIGWDHYVNQAVGFHVIACNPKGGTFELRESMGYGALALDYSDPIEFLLINS